MSSSNITIYQKRTLARLRRHASKNNMTLLSTVYISAEKTLNVKCVCRRIFKTTKLNITKGLKCEFCIMCEKCLLNLEKKRQKVVEICKNNTDDSDLNIDFYIKCECGFVFLVSFKNKVLSNIKCPMCDLLEYLYSQIDCLEKINENLPSC